MPDALATTVMILGLMGAVVVAFRIFVRRPAGLTCEDPPGLRSVAVFSGDDPELFADDLAEEPYVGVRLFGRLCDALAEGGVEVEDRGTIHFAQRAECVAGGQRFALVLERADRHWVASVEWVATSAAHKRHLALTSQVFAPPDSPQLRQLLAALDRSLHADPKLSSVRWYRKERWLSEDTSDPADTPVRTVP